MLISSVTRSDGIVVVPELNVIPAVFDTSIDATVFDNVVKLLLVVANELVNVVKLLLVVDNELVNVAILVVLVFICDC